ncbi:MAG: alpha/beta hydrolase [Rhodobacterales bacterium]|nr:alpha/beta hydrolase [Rhodobacterales bacterium]
MSGAPADPERRARSFRAGDGLSLFYRDFGDPGAPGPAILCLPGLTRNSKDFHGLAHRLGRRHRVLCPDYRGRGRSAYDPDWRRYHPQVYLDDIRHLLAAAGVHRVIVIGTSLGGILAAAMAVTQPTALAGAVINDVGPDIDPAGLVPILRHMKDDQPIADWPAAEARLRAAFPGLPATTPLVWSAITRASYRETEDGRIVPDWDPNLTRAVEAQMADDPVDLWPFFRALGDRPVLTVRGALSDILSADGLAALSAALPAMRSVTVEGVGHAPSLGEPQVLEAIDDLIERISRS